MANTDYAFIKDWIVNGLTAVNGKKLVDGAQNLGSKMKVTNTQFRNVFNELRRIEQVFNEPNAGSERAIRALLLLQPKLAYLSKRDSDTAILVEVLIEAFRHLEGNYEERFPHLMDFAEALYGFCYKQTR